MHDARQDPWTMNYDWQLGHSDATTYQLEGVTALDAAARDALATRLRRCTEQFPGDVSPEGGEVWVDGGALVWFIDTGVLISSSGQDACEAIKSTSDQVLAALRQHDPDVTIEWVEREPIPTDGRGF